MNLGESLGERRSSGRVTEITAIFRQGPCGLSRVTGYFIRNERAVSLRVRYWELWAELCVCSLHLQDLLFLLRLALPRELRVGCNS